MGIFLGCGVSLGGAVGQEQGNVRFEPKRYPNVIEAL